MRLWKRGSFGASLSPEDLYFRSCCATRSNRGKGGGGGGEYLTPLFSPPLLSTPLLPPSPPSLSSLLPPPEEFVVFCPITELQETIYCAILDCEDVQLILHSGEPCNCYSGSKRGECCYRVSSGVHTLYPSPLYPSFFFFFF